MRKARFQSPVRNIGTTYSPLVQNLHLKQKSLRREFRSCDDLLDGIEREKSLPKTESFTDLKIDNKNLKISTPSFSLSKSFLGKSFENLFKIKSKSKTKSSCNLSSSPKISYPVFFESPYSLPLDCLPSPSSRNPISNTCNQNIMNAHSARGMDKNNFGRNDIPGSPRSLFVPQKATKHPNLQNKIVRARANAKNK